MLESPKDADGNCVRGFTRDIGDLRRTQSQNETLMQHELVRAPHLVELLQRSFGIQVAVHLLPWVDCRFESYLQKLIERGIFLLSHVIHEEMKRDTVQKRASVQNLFFALETDPETQKRLLRKILADFTIAALPKAVAKDGSLVEIIGGGEIVGHKKRGEEQAL